MSSAHRVQKPAPPEIDGYLDKLKHKTSLFGAWTRRYFRVNAQRETLEYFSNKSSADSGKPSTAIQLSSIRTVKKFDQVSFQLDAGSDGVYLLRTDSAAELACWIEALETYLRQRMEYGRYIDSIKAAKRRDQLEKEDRDRDDEDDYNSGRRK